MSRILVCHAIFPSQTKYAAVCFKAHGSLEERNIESKFIRQYEEGGLKEYETRIPLNCNVQSLVYHYCTKYDREHDPSYEVLNYYQDYRILEIKDVKSRSADIIHQYDGIVVRQVMSSEEIKGHSRKAFSMHFIDCSHLLQIGKVTAEQFLNMVEEIRKGLANIHRTRQVYESFEDVVNKILIQCLTQMIIDNENIQDAVLVLAISMGIVHLICEFNVCDRLKNEDVALLFKQMEITPSGRETVCHQMKTLKAHFPSKISEVSSSLKKFTTKYANEPFDTMWLFSIPLLHFMMDNCEPYENPSHCIPLDEISNEWWSAEEYRYRWNFFTDKKKQTIPFKEFAPMFDMDYLLPRVVMKLLKPDQLIDAIRSKLFPVHLCIGKLYCYLAENNFFSENDIQIFHQCLLEVYSLATNETQCSESGSFKKKDLLYWTFKLGYTFLVDKTKYNGYIEPCSIGTVAFVCTQTLASVMAMNGLDCESSKQTSENERDKQYQTCRQDFIFWMEDATKTDIHINFVKFWDFLLSLEASNAFSSIDIPNHLQDRLKAMLQQDFSSPKAAICKNKCANLLSSSLKWDLVPGDILFNVAIDWQPFDYYLQLFWDQESDLSPECASCLSKAINVLEIKLKELEDGKICDRDIFLISAEFEKFKRQVFTIWKGRKRVELETLHKYNDKLRSLVMRHRLVNEYLTLCCRITVTDIQKIVPDHAKTDVIAARSLFAPDDLNINHADQYASKLVVFDIKENIFDVMTEILQYKNSCIFLKTWDSIGKGVSKTKNGKMTFQETIDEVGKLVLKKWNEWCDFMIPDITVEKKEFDDVSDDTLDQEIDCILMRCKQRLRQNIRPMAKQRCCFGVPEETIHPLNIQDTKSPASSRSGISKRTQTSSIKITESGAGHRPKTFSSAREKIGVRNPTPLAESRSGVSKETQRSHVQDTESPAGHRLTQLPSSREEMHDWGHNPPAENITRGIWGLANIGSTCYANSILQVLGQTPGLRRSLQKFSSINSENSAASLLLKVVDNINTDRRQGSSSEYLLRLMEKIYNADCSFKRYQQNDCHSFLMSLLNLINEELGQSNPTEGPANLFEGKMSSLYFYNTCDHLDGDIPQKFYSLLIPLKTQNSKETEKWSITKGLHKLMQKEHFKKGSLCCRICKIPSKVAYPQKRTIIVQVPRFLVLQLPRFQEFQYLYYDRIVTHLSKDHSPVRYYQSIRLNETTVYDGKLEVVEKSYELYGVIQHYGSLESGHYDCMVKKCSQKTPGEQVSSNDCQNIWYRCNDTDVTQIPEEEVLIRGENEAYLLFYELVTI